MQAVSRYLALIRWSLLSIACFIVLVSIATFVLNHSRAHDLIVQHLKSQMGIEINTLRIQLIPTARIEVSDLLVRDALTSEPSLRAAHASLSIHMWPLITKRVPMVTLHANEPEVLVQRDTYGRWHLPLMDVEKANAPSDASRHRWMLTDIDLRDGTLRIFDANRVQSRGIGVHHVQALVQSNPTHTQAEVMLSGTTDDGGNLQIAGTLALERFDRLNGSTRKQFDGTLRFQNWDLAYWLDRTGQFLPISSAKTAWRGNLSTGLHLDFPAEAQGFSVAASEITANMGWMTICGQIMVEGAATDHPAYAIALSTSPVSSETLFAHIPSSWVPPHIHAAVAEHQLTGIIELESVALRGKIDVLRIPDEWHMVAKLSNASGRWGNRPAFIRNLSARVSLDSKRADIMHFGGDVNGVHVTGDKLTISDIDLIPTLDAHLIGEGEVDKVMALLKGFSEGTEANPVVRTVSNATGNLRVAVQLAGPIIPKPSLRLISAEMSVRDMGARLARTISIGQVNGTFSADSRLLGITHVAGVLQGIHFQAQGTLDMASPTRVNSLRVEMSSDGTAIQQLLTAYLPASHLRMDGPAHSTVFLSGTSAAVHCHGMIDVTQTEMSLPSLVHKKRGVPGLVEWEGKLFDGKRVIVDRLKLAVPDGELRAVGHVELGHTPKFDLHIYAGPLSFGALAEIGVDTPMSEGIVQTSASVRGEGTNWTSWVTSGWASIRGGVVTLPGLDEKLSELSGRLQITPRGLLFDQVSFRMGDGDVKLTGMVEHWRSHPRATFMVESSELNVSKLVSQKTSELGNAGSNIQDLIQSKEAAITFLVNQLRYERLVLKTVSGEIKVDQHRARLNGLRGETPKGMLSGYLEARFDAADQVEMAAEMSVDGMPAQEVLPLTANGKEPLQGNLSMDGAFQARINRQSPLKDTLSTGGDDIVVKVTNGRLYEDPVLTKVLKILNLPAVLFGQVNFDRGGIPFDSLSARLTVENGVFTSEDIVLDSPVIKVAGAGSADVKHNGLDLALAVSPVAAYSDLIGKVPLFGPVFGGDHPGLTTAVFEAKGSLADPEVTYLPLRSFAKGLAGYPRLAIDVLVNAIKLPPTALAYAAE